MSLIHHPLPTAGRMQPADTDHLLAMTGQGALLLIHIPPGEYGFESHQRTEFIVCVQGALHMIAQADQQELIAQAGEMIEVPPGVVHRFASSCDAVVLTLAQKA